MNTAIIVCMGMIIIVLAGALIYTRKSAPHSGMGDDEITNAGHGKSGQSPLQISDVDQIILQNSLGKEIIFNRPNVLTESKYREVTVHGTGNVVQHVGQGAADLYTLKELGSIAGKELYTSPLSMNALHQYKDGTFSSIVFGKGRIQSHLGFEAFDVSSLSGIKPVMLTSLAMQGMAIISGQYYLKQINSSLQAIGRDIQELKEIHETDTRGVLSHCRKRLMEIAQTQHCTNADITEIRSLANEAGFILEQYKERYYSAKKYAEKFWFSIGLVDNAMNEYNKRLSKMRYLLQICMVADRIIAEAKLTEFVTRRKMDVNDPALQDVYNQMEDNYQNGFNSMIKSQIEVDSKRFIDKGWGIINSSAIPGWNKDLIHKVDRTIREMNDDVKELTSSVRETEEQRLLLTNVALLIDEHDDARIFVEVDDQEPASTSSPTP